MPTEAEKKMRKIWAMKFEQGISPNQFQTLASASPYAVRTGFMDFS
jgi:hypothetical protein